MNIHWIDLLIFIVYLIAMLCVGWYFLSKNKTKDDYYVGGRNMSAGHIGLSVVATDVGGGFSIGLGGLGFTMGISGSWMLFTGLLGAWLSAVLLIPKIYPIAKKHHFLSFPEALQFFYNKKVALIAGIISFIGYIGFTSSQILAGAKLATATFPAISLSNAVLIMGIIAVVYTVIGGIKAVIYTDTIQWIILMLGLICIGIPIGYIKLGGWEVISSTLPASHLSLSNISGSQMINWFFTIVPIWFIGMTLYQRIYSCKDEQTAKKAWRIAGLFEWPIMAFMGVILGMFAKVALDQGLFTEIGYAPEAAMDAELGLPLFLKQILPVGLMGLMMSAYFSAIMSTADSCLMAASGNLMTDILAVVKKSWAESIKLSQWVTLIIGAMGIYIALQMTEVLSLMLQSYAFMVSGLLVPVIMMLYLKKPSPVAAIWSMFVGGSTSLLLMASDVNLPYKLDPIVAGIALSFLVFVLVQKTRKNVAA